MTHISSLAIGMLRRWTSIDKVQIHGTRVQLYSFAVTTFSSKNSLFDGLSVCFLFSCLRSCFLDGVLEVLF